MKRIVLIISFVAAVALCANAQTYIDFHEIAPAPVCTITDAGQILWRPGCTGTTCTM